MDAAIHLPREIPLNRVVSEEWKTSRYATHFMVQFTGQEFILSFYEVLPPVITGSVDEQKEQWDKLESIEAPCVGRITMSPDRFRDMAHVLAQHAERNLNERSSE